MKGIEGRYQATRRAESTKLKIAGLFSQASATVGKDGVLTIEDAKDLRGHPIKWRLVGKDLWQAEDDQAKVFAIRDSHNKVIRAAINFPGVQFQRVPRFENSKFLLPIIGSSLGVLALVVLATFIRVGRRMFLRKRARVAPQPGTIWLTWAPRIAAFMWVALLGGLTIYFAARGDDLMPPTPDWYKWFVLLNGVTALTILFSFFAIVSALRIWTRENLRWITKVKFTLVGLACAILCWFAIHWHLIGTAHQI